MCVCETDRQTERERESERECVCEREGGVLYALLTYAGGPFNKI